jgi:hypothetical protein
MEFLYRTATPAYRGCPPQPKQRTGLLSGLGCYLFGGGSAPVYRTKGDLNGSAGQVAPRCWWQAFPTTPQYKAAPAPDPVDAPSGASCECPEEPVSTEDVPSELGVWSD